ncbi:NAD(P)-dependent oxidoreductase [Streptomyces beihaiensis]|uniref:NAD(P)H-binding protein n=1 Tax=Streptomyces beihaiensis TaxID=2984495 RepID=A0ABT3TSF3_9ACTN|nr:NAD(P)H-binding protein [Streptomyces beihaiensis]MCX3059959.1 NAD(P)H-binding protein [Streptomyces beihaiensis]
MNIVVFGANGPTGRQVVAQATAEGHAVTAVTRRPDGFPPHGPLVEIVGADVHDPAAVEAAVAGHDAVISTLGVPFGRAPVTVYSTGATHITQAMVKHGVSRLACVTSTSVGGAELPGEGFFFRKVLEPFIVRFVGRTVYEDMRRAEEIVRGSDRAWTILRPAGLFDTDTVSDYRMAAGPRLPGRFTSRADLANALLRQVTDGRDIREVVEVRTVEGVPSLLDIIRKEAFGRGTK